MGAGTTYSALHPHALHDLQCESFISHGGSSIRYGGFASIAAMQLTATACSRSVTSRTRGSLSVACQSPVAVPGVWLGSLPVAAMRWFCVSTRSARLTVAALSLMGLPISLPGLLIGSSPRTYSNTPPETSAIGTAGRFACI